MITRDPFDSEVLGRTCGVAEGHVFGGELMRYDHVRRAVDMTQAHWSSSADAATLRGFRLTSIRGTFEGTVLALGDYKAARIPTDVELEQIIGAAPALFSHSRFHHDPFYDAEDVAKIHERWIIRLVNERCLYVVGAFGAPHGFVGFARTTHDGEPMISVELIASIDGRPGSGRHVLNSLVAQERIHRVRAKTQLSNLGAVGLYHALGMKLIKTEAIFTWSKA